MKIVFVLSLVRSLMGSPILILTNFVMGIRCVVIISVANF